MRPEELKKHLQEIFDKTGYSVNKFNVFSPDKKEFGDFSTNLAFKIKKSTSENPDINKIIHIIQQDKWIKTNFEKIEEKNSFINFFLKKNLLYSTIPEILFKKHRYGMSEYGQNKKVLIEFVSANPTGPLTIAHGRQAAFGESISRILSFSGYTVEKEYYLNDCGNQIKLLGLSLKTHYLRMKGLPADIPEDGYHGDYMKDIAARLPDGCENKDDVFFEDFAKEEILKTIKQDLKRFSVHFDRWFSEKELRSSGMVEKIIGYLEKKGFTYQADGAVWFRSTAFGDDKDRVLIKKDGTYTYLAPDIAYHADKINRGYELLINLWGPDHAGYVPRIKAAVAACGFSPEKIHIIIVQLTTLYRGKEKISMSTRKGQFITLYQLMDEVGPDATKFFFLFRKAESHLDFDLELAKKKTDENPVYYIQYAFVRATHIIAFGKENNLADEEISGADFSLLNTDREIEIIKKLKNFPLIVERATKTFEVSTISHYILELAGLFHSYYQQYRVVNENRQISCARLALVQCVYIVMRNGLDLLGISKPETM
ncbi:MAG TPA: arginine--tRNA ligase [bacterium]|nr:arginine--tRNA ligase [bacterium]